MADSESYYEQSPQPPTPVAEYYTDLYYSRGDSKAIVIALTKLFDTLPATIDLTIDDVFDAAFVEYELGVEPRIAGEAFALLPFAKIGPRLDDSNCPLEVLKQWYIDATYGTLQMTRQTHADACYESDGGTVRHMACGDSSICPRRFLERFLTDDAYIPDFSDTRYQRNPARTMQLAKHKLKAALECKIILPEFYDVTVKAYEKKCERYVMELVHRIRSDIDNVTF